MKISDETMQMPSGVDGHQGPSCFDKMKTGFKFGFCVGMASGAFVGGYALRYGLRRQKLISNVKFMSDVMIHGGGTFGTLMTIGTGLRCHIERALGDTKN